MTTKTDLGTTYQTGEKSPVSGSYVCVDCEKAGKHHAMNIREGDKLPECEGEKATWRLESYS